MFAISWITALLLSAPPFVVSDSLFNPDTGLIFLSARDGWTYMPGDDPSWADPDYDDSAWHRVSPAQIRLDADAPDSLSWSGIGWFRFRFTIDSTLADIPLLWRVGTWGGLTLFIDGQEHGTWGRPSSIPDSVIHDHPLTQLPRVPPVRLEVGRTYTMAVRYANHQEPATFRWINSPTDIDPFIRLAKPQYAQFILDSSRVSLYQNMTWIAVLALLTLVFFFFWSLNRSNRLVASTLLFTALLFLAQLGNSLGSILQLDHFGSEIGRQVFTLSIGLAIPLMVIIMSHVVGKRTPKIVYWMPLLWIALTIFVFFNSLGFIALIAYIALAGILVMWRVVRDWSLIKREGWVILVSILLVVGSMLATILGENSDWYTQNAYAQFAVISFIYLSIPVGMLIHIILSYTRLNNERNQKLEKEVAEATAQLKASMAQLVQQEKLASLGQLTAGIAHEIKNPLNFVNNFASVSRELVSEANEEVERLISTFNIQPSTLKDTLGDIDQNLNKIVEHGTRADKIVKSMLLHSRGGSGKMEPTDVNALVQEYANLAFHGMRAAKNPITVDIRYELDPSAGRHPMVAEDFSRVLLNLCNNAFDAMRDVGRGTNDVERSDSPNSTFNIQHSTLILRTKRTPGALLIEVEDNGPGIPAEIQDKILQPFFTTKKGTEGTGLGLSISNDILQAHGGSMSIDSVPGRTTFILTLPC